MRTESRDLVENVSSFVFLLFRAILLNSMVAITTLYFLLKFAVNFFA